MASLFGRGFNPLHLHKKAQLRLCLFGWNGWIEPDYFLFLLPLHLHTNCNYSAKEYQLAFSETNMNN